MRSLDGLGLDALAVLNESPALTYVCSVGEQPELVFVSAAAKSLLGYAPDRFTGKLGFLTSLVHPDDVASLYECYSLALAYGSAVRDRRLKVATGEWRWFRDNLRVVNDADGAPRYCIGTIFDVTDEKYAKAALETRTAEYRILAEHSSDLISRVSFDGRFIYQSPSASRVMGFEADARRGQSALGQIHPDDIAGIEAAWRASYRTREPQTIVYRAFHAEGRWVSLEAVMNPVADPATGKVSEFVIVSRDVTERVEAARRLAEAEAESRLHAETYALFAENGCDFFLRLTPDGRVTHVSPSHARVLGRQPVLKAGRLAEAVHPDDVEAMRATWRQTIAMVSASSFRARVRHEDGRWVWIEARLTPIQTEDGSLAEMIAVCRDVSDQVAADQALAAANRRIKEQGELYDLFATRGSDIFLRFDVEGNAQHVSPSYVRILGRHTLVRDGRVAHLVHPDDMALAENAFHTAFETREPVSYRHRYQHENGSWVWLDVNLTPLTSPETGDVVEYIAVARDVSAHVEAELRLESAQQDLDRSRAQLRLVTDNVADVITMVRPDGTVAYMSPSVTKVIGYTPQEMMAQTRMTLIHPDDFALSSEEIERNRRGDVTPLMRYRVQRRDGAWIWVERRASLVRDPMFGEGAAILSVLRDVTADVDRERQIAAANAALERSRTRLQLVTDNMEDVVALYKPDGSAAYISPSACNLIGYTLEEFAALPPENAVHPDDRAMLKAEMAANRFGRIAPLMRYRMLHKDGRTLWIERRARAIPDHDFGEGTAVLVVSSDVTDVVEQERHTAEALAALEESRVKLQTIIDNSVDVIAVFGPGRTFEYLSRSCEQQSGYTVEDFTSGRASLSHPGDESIVAEALAREDAGGDGETFRYRGVRKDGAVIWLERRARKVYGQDGAVRYIVTVTRDISEEVRHEREMAAASAALEKAKVAAEVASVAKSQFLATMSHELRTPMTGVMGMLDLLKGSTLDGEQARFANVAYESAENLLTILNDILDFSKIEAGQLKIEPEPFALRTEIEKVTSLLAPVAHRKGTSLRTTIDAALPDRLTGDAARIRQVLFNLVGNAVKFTSEGLVSVGVSAQPHGRVRLEVRDTGIGIPQASLALLFQPFVQADGSSRRKAGGTGLGLAISKSLVEAMGGRIGVESEEGRGSLFWVELPLKAAEEVQAAALPRTADAKPRRRFDILVAEDHPVNQQLLSALLKREGHAATIVGNGALAVEAIQRRAFDLVLMDVQMPVLDGIAATRAIRALAGPPAQIPIVAITANALRGDMENYLAAGMTGYVSKPIRIEALREAMETAVPHTDDDTRTAVG
jgi:PAS domain S-box-containing protein